MTNDEIQKSERITRLCEILPELTNRQFNYIETVVLQLHKPFIEKFRNPDSDIINECVLQNLGDSIRIHHCFSKSPFTKDKFEYALDVVMKDCGFLTKLAPPGNPGYDIIINDTLFSLKTEAQSSIRFNKIHISKLMELGKGEWVLEKLRHQFLNHLNNYERILTLRCLSKLPNNLYYELVEIPKSLFQKSIHGKLRIMESSKQEPKPGYCDVVNQENELLYQLYFDAGGERKLQIKNLDKKACILQAFWRFSSD